MNSQSGPHVVDWPNQWPAIANQSPPRRWAVVMAQGPRRLVEACGFRIESGAVVFVEPVGCVAAFAPGTWLQIEEDRTNA